MSIVAGRDATADLTLDADYVIVGSGAAGATAAVGLAEAGYEVIVCEEGPLVREADFTASVWRTMKTLFRDTGTTFMSGRSFIPVLQGRCVGGSTVINSAITWRVPEDVHAAWLKADPALGESLPYADLCESWAAIERDIHVQPVPEAVAGGNSLTMARGAAALGYKGKVIDRNVAGCEGAALCLQGCPTGRKQSMAVSYIPRALKAGARLVTDCRVDAIDHAGGRATGLRATLLGPSPRRFTAVARRGVVLAASALQSPALLQKSGLGGIGPVGRHFQCHPGVSMLAIYPDKVDMWSGATQGYEVDHFRDRRMKLESIALPPELLILRLPGIASTLGRYLERAQHMALWGAQIRARAEGTVRASGHGVKASFTPNAEDVDTLRLGLRVCAEVAFAGGAECLLPGIHGLPERVDDLGAFERELPKVKDVRQLGMIATHLFGTTRMGSDPRDAVLDPRFEAHQVKRLWVVDSSTFPSNLGVNPQHTIMGMAAQAVKHILARG